MTATNESRLIDALHAPDCYPHEVGSIEVVETHISWIVLTGRIAYKIKKPVKLPFLDFTTLEARRHFCEEEMRLNRRLAAPIYLGLVPVGGSPDAPRVGAEPAIEYAIKMRQFAATARLDLRIASGEVGAEAIRRFALDIADFHSREPAIRDLESVHRDPIENVAELRQQPGVQRFADELAKLETWTVAQSEALLPFIERRLQSGFFKECHGDLHLENVIVDDGRLVAFDALEFDRSRRCIDPMNETAFFAMDLMAHARADLAYVFLSRYLEALGDYDGVPALRFYLVYRALVRAKVCALKQAAGIEPEAPDRLAEYVRLAAKLTAPQTPTLVITHGLSGSGKTHITGSLIGSLRAIRVRSDLERKRMAGLAERADSRSPVGGGLYGQALSERTYEGLLRAAQAILGGGFNCIVDATFLERSYRDRFLDLAKSLRAGFVILHCDADESTLRQRVEQRERMRSDASEAGTEVLDHQLARQELLQTDESDYVLRVDTAREVDAEAIAGEILNRP